MDAKLFFVLVVIDQGNLIEGVTGTLVRGMILRIHLLYFSWIVYS